MRLGGNGGLIHSIDAPPESLAWSSDSRWLFVVAANGNLLAVNARTGRVESLGITLPRIEQVVIALSCASTC